MRLKVLLRRFPFSRELDSPGTPSKVVLKARKFIKHILAKNLLNFGFHHFKQMEYFIPDPGGEHRAHTETGASVAC